MKKKLSIFFAALCLSLCLLPSVGMLCFGEAQAGANQVLASAPALRDADGRLNRAYLGDLSAYIRDRFFLRQEAITAWNWLNAKVLGTSAAEDVLLGRDGWLYYADTLADYCRSDPLTERELWCAARTVFLMEEYAQSQGCRFLFTLCPNKNSLYPQHMKGYARLAGEGDAERFYEVLAQMGVSFLDLEAVFLAQEEELYFATDSHWNGKGAALGADAILEALGREGGWFAGGFTAGEAHTGDLYEMLYPAGRATEADYAPAAGFTFRYVRPIRGPTDITIQTEGGSGQGSLLCFRDSFGNSLYPYLAERFESAVFSRLSTYDLSYIGRYGADTVVVELVERNIAYLNLYAPVFPAPEREAELDGARAAEAVTATAEESGLEGFVLVQGSLPAAAGESSPVYLLWDGTLYEATPGPGTFTAHLPAVDSDPAAQLIYSLADGQPVSAPVRVEK